MPSRDEWPALGARVVTLCGAVAALLALGLPWAREEVATKVDMSRVLTTETTTRIGWDLAAVTAPDGRRSVPVAMVVLFLGVTVLAALGAWLLFELPRRRWVAVTLAVLAAAALVASLPVLSDLPAAAADGDRTVDQHGIVIWRVALLVALLGAVRLAVLQEEATRRRRDA